MQCLHGLQVHEHLEAPHEQHDDVYEVTFDDLAGNMLAVLLDSVVNDIVDVSRRTTTLSQPVMISRRELTVRDHTTKSHLLLPSRFNLCTHIRRYSGDYNVIVDVGVSNDGILV